MIDDDYTRWIVEAERNFNLARRRAFLEDAVGRLRRRPKELLSFEVARRKLGLLNSRARGVSEIPLDRIVGSVGKSREFTRTFWPRREEIRARWQRVFTLIHSARGLPPIEVYQVGEVYFVLDGHHRVSVGRLIGLKMIEAHITEFVTPIRLTGDILDSGIDDLTLKTPDPKQRLAGYLPGRS